MNKVSSLCGEVKIISRVYSCSSAVQSIVYPFNADEAPFFKDNDLDRSVTGRIGVSSGHENKILLFCIDTNFLVAMSV